MMCVCLMFFDQFIHSIVIKVKKRLFVPESWFIDRTNVCRFFFPPTVWWHGYRCIIFSHANFICQNRMMIMIIILYYNNNDRKKTNEWNENKNRGMEHFFSGSAILRSRCVGVNAIVDNNANVMLRFCT